MWRSSVLLPLPLSPMTTKIEPRRMEKETSSCTTKSP